MTRIRAIVRVTAADALSMCQSQGMTMTTRFRVALLASCLVLAACGDPVEKAYGKCMAKVKDASTQADKDAADNKDPMAQAMAPAMKEMASKMGQANCDLLHEVCKQDPKGQDCKAAIAEFK